MKRAMVFLADGCEMVEALTPVDLLRRAGVEVETVSVKEDKKIASSHNVTIMADKTLDEISGEYDALILPGGMPGTINLEACEKVIALVKEQFDAGRLVAAICAAPSILGDMGILEGRHAACYPSFEDRLKGAIVTMNEVEVDGTVITSRGMGTAIPFALAIIGELFGIVKAQEIAEQVIYRMGEVNE